MECIGYKGRNEKNCLTLTGRIGGGEAIQRQRNGERNSVQRQLAPRESLNLAILTNVLDYSHNSTTIIFYFYVITKTCLNKCR